MTSARMMINVRIMVRSRVPIKYITQLGMLRGWAVAGAGGVICIGVGWVGMGVNVVVGAVSRGVTGVGDSLSVDVDTATVWGDSVVKAPTALQALWVLALTALTRQ